MRIPTFDSSKNKKIMQKILTLYHLKAKVYTILTFLSAIVFMSKKNTLICMPCLTFSFSDEKFDQNGEKSVGKEVKK